MPKIISGPDVEAIISEAEALRRLSERQLLRHERDEFAILGARDSKRAFEKNHRYGIGRRPPHRDGCASSRLWLSGPHYDVVLPVDAPSVEIRRTIGVAKVILTGVVSRMREVDWRVLSENDQQITVIEGMANGTQAAVHLRQRADVSETLAWGSINLGNYPQPF